MTEDNVLSVTFACSEKIMTGKNCPFCGAEIEPGKARDKLVRKESRFNALSAEIKIARALNRLKARDHVN